MMVGDARCCLTSFICESINLRVHAIVQHLPSMLSLYIEITSLLACIKNCYAFAIEKHSDNF